MKTPRQRLIEEAASQGMNPTQVMDYLQFNGGPISDLCVRISDVCDHDCERAVIWLRKNAIASKPADG